MVSTKDAMVQSGLGFRPRFRPELDLRSGPDQVQVHKTCGGLVWGLPCAGPVVNPV